MPTIFCRLERIGGISGKRIQIRRATDIIVFPSEEMKEIWSKEENEWGGKKEGRKDKIANIIKEIRDEKEKEKVARKLFQDNPIKPKPKTILKSTDFDKINKVKILYEKSQNTLKVKDESIDLDRFMEIMKEQLPNIEKCMDIKEKIAILEYEKGEVSKFGLIEIKQILKNITLDSYNSSYGSYENHGDLNKGNYPFDIKGLNATIK